MKQEFSNTNLVCSLQPGSEVTTRKRLSGTLLQGKEGFRFEEEASRVKPHTRNPKVFNGKYVSLMRKEDNSLQFAFKAMQPDFDHENFAFMVYQEVANAIKMID